MTGKTWSASPQKLVEVFYKAMQAFPSVELRKMFGYPCAFVNGNMFVGLHQNDLAVRLAPSERQSALNKGEGSIFAPMKGRVMKEYISLSESLIYDKQALYHFLMKSFEYVKQLPPKISVKKAS